MGYFSNIAESAFRKNPDGQGWLYYPNGSLGKGRIVTDYIYKEKLFNFQRRMYMFLLPFGLLYGLSIDIDNFSLSNLYPLAIILPPIFIRQYILIRKLPISTVKLNTKEEFKNKVKALPNYHFYILYICSAGLIITGSITPVLFDKPYSEINDLVLMQIIPGLLFFIIAFYMHKFKKSNKQVKRQQY